MNLENQILELLKSGDKSIPTIRDELSIKSEFVVMKIIANLEHKNKVELKSFKKVYREDGGAIHLAVYGIKTLINQNNILTIGENMRKFTKLVEKVYNQIKEEFPLGCKGIKCENCVLIVSINAPEELQFMVDPVCSILRELSKIEE